MPPFEHPETVFVSPEDVQNMEDRVENIRPSRGSKSVPADVTSDYQAGIRVPNAILEECQKSFVAADSNRMKASTQFFADTGLMAMLCRHDRVLFLANMTSAGEKQHYVLCLLEILFKHIPKTMRIGVLYDIICQLHRSCMKHGFLPDMTDRIVFGLAVFHAYGHQWPCQLIYHPRKCVGFGLSDGEGCERFWGSIKALIPNLWVSGYHNRIYTLNTQIKHLDMKSLHSLGAWLSRKWMKLIDRRANVQKILQGLAEQGKSLDFLDNQWKEQVKDQTMPLKKQSAHLANKELHDIMALLNNIERYKEQMQMYEEMFLSGKFEEGLTAFDVQDLMEDVEKQCSNAKKSVAKKREKLSIDGRLNLQRLIDNEFLQMRMNALALKQRIRDKLHYRKFELDNLVRSYQKTSNQLKLDQNANQQIKRKEPGIQALVRKYNALCLELEKMIKQKKAPRGSIVPIQIELVGLFALDVDDNIWQDIGLTDENDGMLYVPLWLANEDVREGIKAMLDFKRCQEEENRLIHECRALQEWMQEEWKVVEMGLKCASEDENVLYLLKEHQQSLLKLCLKWEPAVRIIPCHLEGLWGPTLQELAEYRSYENSAQVVNDSDDFDDIESDNGDEQDYDASFLDEMETFSIGEEYRHM